MKTLKNGWSRALRSELDDAFSDTDFSLAFGDGYLNIARPDGLNCEFYPCGQDAEYCMLTATYTIDGKERELDFEIPYQTEAFVAAVKKVLK